MSVVSVASGVLLLGGLLHLSFKQGSWPIARTQLAVLALPTLFMPLLLRWTGRIKLGANLLSVFYLTAMLLSCYGNDGLNAFMVIALPLGVIVSAFISGPAVAWPMAFVLGAGVTLMELTGFVAPTLTVPLSDLGAARMWAMWSSLFIVAAAVHYFLWSSAKAIAALGAEVVEHEETEQLLLEAWDLAEEGVRAKETFLSQMSHEIRTPMNGLMGMAELLVQMKLEPHAHEMVETIHDSAQGLLRLLDDVLDLSKATAGEVAIEREPLEVASLLGEVVSLFSVQADAKGLRLSYRLEAPLMVVADGLRLRQILSNLVANAIKFTPEGHVEIQGQHVGTELELRVQDTGIGIPAKRLERVFEAFGQADGSITRRFGGTGLGLTISRRLARLMDGTLTVESEVGVGSTFIVRLPAESVAKEEVVVPITPPPHGRYVGRVLVVEDNVVNQKVASLMLVRLGCEVSFVEDGALALEATAAHPFDLILMDCQMPVMDGWTATERIIDRDGASAPPIVALTAQALAGDEARCVAAGMMGYLTKPISLHRLEAVLAVHLAVASEGGQPEG